MTLSRRISVVIALVVVFAIFSTSCQTSIPTVTQTVVPTVVLEELADPIKWALIVRQDGPHWISPEWFASQGVPMEYIDLEHLALYHGDALVPIHIVESEAGSGILFLAETELKRIGNVGGYVLVLGEAGLAMPAQPSADGAVCQETTQAYSILEQDNEYRSTAPGDPPWFWQALRAPQQMDVTLVLTDAIAQPADITLTFWSQSRMPQDPDHQIRVLWNGETVDDHFWDAGTLVEDTIERWTITSPKVTEETVALTLDSPGETEAPVEMTWLDRIEVSWTKRLTVQPESWQTWHVDNSTNLACFETKGDVNRAVALLLSSDGSTHYVAPQVSPTFSVSHADAVLGWVGIPEQAREPAVMRLQEVVVDDVTSADYIILAHQQWHEYLAPLVQRRSEEGLTVAVVTPNQVYDSWGDGTPDSAAITVMVRDLVERGSLKYLLIIGEASADPRPLWQAPESFIPTGWVRTTYVGDTSSDVVLVADEEGMPLVAVGRMLPDSQESLQIMVQKTLDWEPNNRLMIVNDNEAQFERMSDSLSDIYQPDRTINSADENARSQVLEWLQADKGTFVYTGHGSLPVLGDEKILTFEDAAGWKGPTVVVAWSCLCGTYAHPVHTGLGEAWLEGRDGTVAFVGPTGETTTSEQTRMALALQTAMTGGARIGDALMQAWLESTSQDARLSFVLLGDPALQPFPASNE